MLNRHSPCAEVLFWDFLADLCNMHNQLNLAHLSAFQKDSRVIFELFLVILLHKAPSRSWHPKAKRATCPSGPA